MTWAEELAKRWSDAVWQRDMPLDTAMEGAIKEALEKAAEQATILARERENWVDGRYSEMAARDVAVRIRKLYEP